MDVPTWAWALTLGLIAIMLTVDFVGHVRKPHAPSLKEAAIWSVVYIVIALLFGGFVWLYFGGDFGFQYFTGYITEKSLSVDNLFVFVLIMASFRVPRAYQQKVLLIGIVMALVLRTVFILLGKAMVEQFSWVFYLFGAFLLWTAYKQIKGEEEDEDGEFRENLILRLARRFFPTTEGYVGDKLFTRHDGKMHITPMLIVILAIGTADILFAVDSIPAIFGITEEVFLIFAANAFSLLGLRQLFFLIDGLLDKLTFLNYGLAAILAFIGAKLVIHAMHVNELPFLNGGEHITLIPEIDTKASLLVIVGILGITTWMSLAFGQKEPAEGAAATGSDEPDPSELDSTPN